MKWLRLLTLISGDGVQFLAKSCTFFYSLLEQGLFILFLCKILDALWIPTHFNHTYIYKSYVCVHIHMTYIRCTYVCHMLHTYVLTCYNVLVRTNLLSTNYQDTSVSHSYRHCYHIIPDYYLDISYLVELADGSQSIVIKLKNGPHELKLAPMDIWLLFLF